MISKDELKKRLKEEVDKLPPSEKTYENIWKLVAENMKYTAEHLDELAPDAKELLDKQIESMKDLAGVMIENYKQKPDSIENRKALRQLRLGAGSHFEILSLLQSLDMAKNLEDKFVKDSNDFFVYISQLALDFLSDIGSAKLENKDIIFLALFYSAIDEVTIAHHLALHKYAPQSLSHSRIVLDILEKIELFDKKPSEIDIWTSGDEKLILREFKPSRVREKLGKSKYNPTYSDLSNKGSHASFDYIQSKVKQKFPVEGNRLEISINVGGSSNKEDKEHAHVACVHVTGLIIYALLAKYRKLLLPEEIKEREVEMMVRSDKYYKKVNDATL